MKQITDKQFFEKYQKILLWLFNIQILQGWLGIPVMARGRIHKVTPNTVHKIIGEKDGVLEVEMFAMVHTPQFAMKIKKVTDILLSISAMGASLFTHSPLPMAMMLTSTDFGTAANGDGVTGNSGAVWATVRGAATGNDSNTALTYMTIQGDRLNGGTYYIYRGYLPADTSALGSGVTITSATLYTFNFGILSWTGSHNISVVTTTQASTSSLATSDFSLVGNTDLGNFSVGGQDALGTGYTVVISSPNTNISKTGFTKLGLRETDHDLANTAATNDRYDGFCSQDHATSGYRPFYRIVYSVAGNSRFFAFM